MNMLTLIRKNRSLDSNVVDFGYHPDLADHRSSNNAFGMLSSWYMLVHVFLKAIIHVT